MKKRSFRSRGTALAGWVLVPGVLLCHLFPLLLTFGYAVTRSAFDRQFVALENFRYLFSNRFFRLGCANLLLLGALALALGLAVVLLLGFLLRLLRWVLIACCLLSWAPFVAPRARGAAEVSNLVLQDLMRLVLGGRDLAVGFVSFGPLILWWVLGIVHPLLAGLL